MNPKVSVCIVTYNHEHYIRQCLQSVVEQHTNFDVEIIVSDDASTDKTRDIIAEFCLAYPQKIKPIFLEENIGAFENFIQTHQRATGKYVCHCDGDDYFLDGKLQAQADILDAEKSCTAVWHRMDFFNDAGHFCSGDTADLSVFENGVVTFNQAIRYGFVGMHSALMYRRSAQKWPLVSGTKVLDLFRTWDMLSSGDGKMLNTVFGRYRVGATGSVTTNSLLAVRRLSIDHARFFYKNFPHMRKNFFVFALSNFIIDLRNLRASAIDFFVLAMRCFVVVFPTEIMKNLREMRQIQVAWKQSLKNER